MSKQPRGRRYRAHSRVAIDLDRLTARDLADVAAVCDGLGLGPADRDPRAPSPGLLAALIWVTLRRDEPGITPARCVRMALRAAIAGAADGGR